MSRTAGRRHHCPLCRTSAFGQKAPCHIDTLQLLRARLRLSDLAYSFFQYELNPYEAMDRVSISEFLNRRYNDNEILGEHEIRPSPQKCRTLFKQARDCLRIAAYRYMRIIPQLPAAEQLRVIQLIMFFENFELKNDNMRSFFFDPESQGYGRWKAHFPVKDISYHHDPKGFFSRVVFEPESAGSDATSSTEILDGGMFDAPYGPTAQEYLERRERLRRHLTYGPPDQ